MVDVAIVTVKREELEALLERFSIEMEAPHDALKTEYNFRRVHVKGGPSRTVAITRCTMQGNGDAQTVTKKVLADLQPGLLFVVGIAGMPPSSDLFLGDIVLGTHVHDFNLAAESMTGLEFAETGASPPYWLTRYVCNLDTEAAGLAGWYSQLDERPTTQEHALEFTAPLDNDWKDKIIDCVKRHKSRRSPKVLDGPIASSDDLIKNPDAVRKRLAVDRRIIAVEMESAGAARACNNVGRVEASVPFLPIRAISDIVGLKRDPAWEKYACGAAALFTLRFIQQLPEDFFASHHRATSPGDEIVRAIMCLTTATRRPLPLSVLGSAAQLDEARLRDLLKDELASGRVVERDGGVIAPVSHKPVESEISLPEPSTFLSALLESLLHYISEHAEDEKGIGQAKGAVILAKTVLVQAPHLAGRVYDALDHPIKAIGDKALVREMAQTCIDAASKRPNDRDAAECIARARICGLSWVYQRTNELDLAQDQANKSLELGRKLGFLRNDAFCLKCLGRLLRMRAEQTQDQPKRRSFLTESVDSLHHAIKAFSELPEFGRDHSQVGDCYSLLGRSYLVSGDFANAGAVAKEAKRRITDDASKAFLDLQILLGDLALKLDGSAQNHYDTVIAQQDMDADFEKSEIVARALLHRGIAKKNIDSTAAIQDFKAAAKIWSSLGEDYFAFDAEWEAIKLQEHIPAKTLHEIEKDRPEICVKAYEWIAERTKNRTRNVVGQRKGHDLVTWRQALKATREKVALQKYR